MVNIRYDQHFNVDIFVLPTKFFHISEKRCSRNLLRVKREAYKWMHRMALHKN